MSRKQIEGFVPPTAGSVEKNRHALASLKARMAISGELQLQKRVDDLIEMVVGVRPVDGKWHGEARV